MIELQWYWPVVWLAIFAFGIRSAYRRGFNDGRRRSQESVDDAVRLAQLMGSARRE